MPQLLAECVGHPKPLRLPHGGKGDVVVPVEIGKARVCEWQGKGDVVVETSVVGEEAGEEAERLADSNMCCCV